MRIVDLADEDVRRESGDLDTERMRQENEDRIGLGPANGAFDDGISGKEFGVQEPAQCRTEFFEMRERAGVHNVPSDDAIKQQGAVLRYRKNTSVTTTNIGIRMHPA